MAAEFLAERALTASNLEHADAILRGLKEAIQRKPDSPSLWWAQAVMLQRIGKLDESFGAFSRAIDLASTNNDNFALVDTLLRRSHLLRELKRGAEAGVDERRACGLPWRQIQPGAFTDYQSASDVSVEFGATNREAGLHVIERRDSKHTLAQVEGEQAEFFEGGWNYAYFFIDPTFKWGLGSNVLVRVEYRSMTSHTIGLQYDGYRDIYSRASTRSALSTGKWQVIEFVMRDARFQNSQNGHTDFRLYDNEAGFYVKRIAVSRYERMKPATVPVAVPAREPGASKNLIDLTSFFNLALTDSLLSGRPGNDAGTLPSGIQVLDGVEFDVRGVIQLSSKDLRSKVDERFPIAVTNIPISRKLKSFHVLHGAGYAETNGAIVGFYILHYHDGESASLPIIYGEHVIDWSRRKNSSRNELPGASLAWTGRNKAADLEGLTLRLYRAKFTNARPNEEVDSMSFASSMSHTALFLFAITVEP
jgi:tetratricopeptide (TPR) repeat protein